MWDIWRFSELPLKLFVNVQPSKVKSYVKQNKTPMSQDTSKDSDSICLGWSLSTWYVLKEPWVSLKSLKWGFKFIEWDSRSNFFFPTGPKIYFSAQRAILFPRGSCHKWSAKTSLFWIDGWESKPECFEKTQILYLNMVKYNDVN